jgi:hypothetical protein
MNRIQCTKSFYQDEFIFPNGDFQKVDPKIVLIAQWVRDTIDKPVTINNYATGGKYKESGLRDINTKTGAKKSAHKEGKAIDIKVKGMTAKEVYEFCLKHSDTLYAMGVREIEDQRYTSTWCHLSTRGNWERIKIIKP